MKPQGFTPKNFQLRPAIISFALVLIGLGLTALAVFFYYLNNTVDLFLLPPMTLICGLTITLSSIAYLLNRKRKIAEAKRTDEKLFSKWVKENYSLTLTQDQNEQLFYYGATIVNNKKYVLHYEIENDVPTAYIYSETEWKQNVETSVINALNETGTIKTIPTLPPGDIEIEEDLEEVRKALEETSLEELRTEAKELGLKGYNKLDKAQLIEALTKPN